MFDRQYLADRRKILKWIGIPAATGLMVQLIPRAFAAYGNPTTWKFSVGIVSAPLLPNSPNRKALIFHNNSGAGGPSVAFCSAYDGGPNGDGVAVINGAGCITMPPGSIEHISPTIWTGAINGIASAAGAPFTILEFTA